MVGIPMGTNCAPLLADLFLYSYENEFLDKLIKEGKRKLGRRFNLSYCYIDHLISFNNKRFKEFISDIYPKELTISETTECTSVASYLDLLFTQDRSNNITTKLYDKRDAFGFHIVNFPFMSSNIPSAPPQKKCFEISARSQKDLRKPEISMRSHFKCEISVKSQKYN